MREGATRPLFFTYQEKGPSLRRKRDDPGECEPDGRGYGMPDSLGDQNNTTR